MRRKLTFLRETRQWQSLLLIFLLVSMTMAVLLPLTAPRAKGQVTHLMSCFEEDMTGLPYDIGPVGDGEVIWDPNEDHLVTEYIIEPGMTLNIPPLNYLTGDPSEHEITFTGLSQRRIDVYGTLLTNLDSLLPPTYTAFMGQGGGWDGIFVKSGGQARLYDCLLTGSLNGIVFEPNSSFVSPGIAYTNFENMGNYGVRMDGVTGSPSMNSVIFYDQDSPGAYPVIVKNGSLDMSVVSFVAHGPNEPSISISNSTVNMNDCQFNGFDLAGPMVLIEDGSNGTTISGGNMQNGEPGVPMIQVEGSTVLVEETSIDTSNGEISVHADEDASGVPSHVTLRHLTADGTPGMWDNTFDNSSVNVTGTSSITFQWYINAYVEDPNGNLIANAPVWVKDTLGTPSVPPSILTDGTGWADGFLVTEKIQYNDSQINYNDFNISAENNSVIGYAIPELPVNMSMEVVVVVPFSLVPNVLPTVTYVSTPVGIQSGPVTIDYIVTDPNPGDSGNLSVEVFYTYSLLPPSTWNPATAHVSSPPTTNLINNTQYSYVWDSADPKDMGGLYDTQVYIKIIPSDKSGGQGTELTSSNFTVDNMAPQLMSGPTATPSNTTCLVEWTMDEPCDATVYYGLTQNQNPGPGDITDSTSDPGLSASHAVTITGLEPGRRYTCYIESSDGGGNTYTFPGYITFDTEIHIQLYTGWNMVSFPPGISPRDIDTVFASISGDYDIIRFYDVLSPWDPWKNYIPGKPFGNDLHTVYEQMGFMVHMLNDAVLVHTTHQLPWGPNPGDRNPTTSTPIVGGWNMIGYPSVTNRDVTTVMAGISYDLIMTYNAETGEFEYWDGTSGNLSEFKMGQGYWIHAPDGEQFLDVDYRD